MKSYFRVVRFLQRCFLLRAEWVLMRAYERLCAAIRFAFQAVTSGCRVVITRPFLNSCLIASASGNAVLLATWTLIGPVTTGGAEADAKPLLIVAGTPKPLVTTVGTLPAIKPGGMKLLNRFKLLSRLLRPLFEPLPMPLPALLVESVPLFKPDDWLFNPDD